MQLQMTRFEPAEYSIPDLRFLADHIGSPPLVAMRKQMEPGTHRARLEFILREVYDRNQLQEAEEGYKWAGKQALIDSITRFLEWNDRSLEIARRGHKDASGARIIHPSFYVWDGARAYKGGVDSDSYDMVRSEILDNGERRQFGVMLDQPEGEILPDISSVAPWVKSGGVTIKHDDKILDEKSEKDRRIGTLRCSICDYTEQYDVAKRSTRNLSMARMSRHLRTAKVMQNRHRVLLTKTKG